MTWELNSDKPVYLQLMEQIKQDILTGVYRPGDKLPSVRELAFSASVNPNTMQKALSELEREGLLFTERTSGRFITENKELIQTMKNELVYEEIKQFLERMDKLGISYEEVISILKEKNN